ncbi:hypothetical protein HJFPF1_03727 [Paramyrothecium foliicola]|nr:hypothetical protein HJFPF1_03727 [Paramyrothecium foliicola]
MYIYKILPSSPPEPLPAEFPLSDLDRNDGFVHLSTATQAGPPSPTPNVRLANVWQVPQTGDLFFKDFKRLWIVKLDLANFEKDLKWEGGFPHLYGNFGAAGIESIQKFERAEGQTWTQSMAGSEWLQ